MSCRYVCAHSGDYCSHPKYEREWVMRTDGKPLCDDCLNWLGSYAGCAIKANNSTSVWVQSCMYYTNRKWHFTDGMKLEDGQLIY